MEVLFLGSDTHAEHVVRSALPPGTRCIQTSQPAQAFPLITSEQPPSAFVIDSPSLDQRCIDDVIGLATRGLLIPTALFFVRADAQLFDRAWCLAPLRVERLFCNDDLAARLEHLLGGGRQALSAYLLSRLRSGGAVARKLLDRLAEDPDAASCSTRDLAAAINVSRSALYKELKREGVPGVGRIQLAYRLLPAQRSLASGGSLAESARSAGYADVKNFRDGLAAQLDWSTDDLSKAGWRGLADRCLERTMKSGAGARERPIVDD